MPCIWNFKGHLNRWLTSGSRSCAQYSCRGGETQTFLHLDAISFRARIPGDSHGVEGSVYKDEGYDKEQTANEVFRHNILHLHSNFHRQQSEQRREFDDWIESH